jgi:hypothetical protein
LGETVRWIGLIGNRRSARKRDIVGGETPPDTDLDETRRRELARANAAYDKYTARIQKILLTGAIITMGVFALFALLAATNSPPSPSPRLIFGKPDDSLAPSVFAILASIVIAIQLATRTRSEVSDEEEAARRRFLSSVAFVLVPTSFGLGLYLLLPFFEAAPEGRDFTRLVLCGGGSLLLAVIAADAGTALEEPDEVEQAVNAERFLRERREWLQTLEDGSLPPRKVPSILSWIVVVSMPLLLGFALGTSLGGSPRALLLGVVLAAFSGAWSYVVVGETFVAAARNTWSYLTPPTLAYVPSAAAICLVVVQVGFSAPGADIRLLALLLLLAILSFAAPALLAVVLLRVSRGRRRVFREIVVARARKMVERAERTSEKKPAAPVNKIAVAALLLSWIFPLGIVLGHRAKLQIAAAGVDDQDVALSRGSALILVARIVSFLALGLPVLALVVLMILNPAWS